MQKEVDVPKVILLFLLGATFVLILAFFLFGPVDYTKEYLQRIAQGEIKNPTSELSNSTIVGNNNMSVNDTTAFFSSLRDKLVNQTEENLSNLIKQSITYSLVYIKAYNLHNPPLSSDTPKIQFLVDNNPYNSEIIKGEIYTNEGQAINPDITIKTSQEEILKMTSSQSYIQESINSGKTEIDLDADKTILFLKGYTNLNLNFG